jgi:hypothetical protein
MKKETTNKVAKKAAKKTAARKAPPKKAMANKAPGRKRPVRKAGKKATTKPTIDPEPTLQAEIDIGFGNLLYLRGDAPGLSWEKGTPMDCNDESVWSWSTTATVKSFTYKVLVNDISWSVGEDFTAHAGKANRITPEF